MLYQRAPKLFTELALARAEGRHGRMLTIPPAHWHELIGDPTYADAILDRLLHNAHRIELTGESLRKTRKQTPKAA